MAKAPVNVGMLVLVGCGLGIVCLIGAAGAAWLISELVFWQRARSIPPEPVIEYADGTKIFEWELNRLTDRRDL
jgi:hypothetical protein